MGFLRWIATDGLRAALAFRYDRQLLPVLRQLAGEHSASYVASLRAWVMPADEAELFTTELWQRLERPTAELDAVHERLGAAAHAPAPDLVAPALGVVLLPTTEGQTVLLSAWDAVLIRAMHLEHARFSRELGAWVLAAGVEDAVQALATRAGIQPRHVQVDTREVEIDELAAGTADAGAELQPGDVAVPEAGTRDGERFALLARTPALRYCDVDARILDWAERHYSLFAHQREGVAHLLGCSAPLLADDMGLGKTRQAVAAAHIAGTRRLVVCPASLKWNWAAEIATVASERVQTIEHSRQAVDSDVPWVVVNYELAGHLTEATARSFDTLIADEAHGLKAPRSRRTKDVFLLAAAVDRLFLLSGTPILNHIDELHTLLRLAGHPLGALALKEFRGEFDDDAGRRALSRRLDGWMLRRRKEAVADLPPKVYSAPVVEPPRELMQRYRALLNDDRYYAIDKLHKLIALVEAAKEGPILDWVRATATTDKSIIFTRYRQTARTFCEALCASGVPAVMLTGTSSSTERQRACERFQGEPDTRVFVGTLGAAGQGLNLTGASYVWFASRPWTRGAEEQAEDRAHRHGQTKRVQIVRPRVPGTIDDQIARLVDTKGQLAEQVVDERAAGYVLAKALSRGTV